MDRTVGGTVRVVSGLNRNSAGIIMNVPGGTSSIHPVADLRSDIIMGQDTVQG